MRWFLACVVAALVPLSVQAQTATVRSGAHDGFARLVVTFPRPLDWVLGRFEGGYALRPGRSDVSFDFGGVFRLIPRDRIADLMVDPSSGDLLISLGCLCTAETGMLGTRILVIDIRDGAPGRTARHEARLPPLGGRVAVMGVAPRQPEPPAPVPAWAPVLPADRTITLAELSAVQRVAGHDGLPDLGSSAAARGLSLPLSVAASDRGLQRALAEAVARAAAEGLVDAARTPELAGSETNVPDPPSGRPNIRIETGFDRAGQSIGPDAFALIDPARDQCHAGTAYDVPSWGNAEDPTAALGAARAEVIGARDGPDEAAVLRLARLYTYLSFGAEARGVLEAFGATGDEAGITAAIARIVDGHFGEAPETLAPEIGCPGPGALWALLAADPLPPPGVADVNALLLAHAALPSHLRTVIGPELGLRLLALGESESALVLHRRLPPPSPNASAARTLFEARLGERGLLPENRDALVAVGTGDLPEAGDALLKLIEADLAAGRPVDIAALESAAILAFERVGTAEAPRLKAAEIRARLTREDFDGATQALTVALDQGVLSAEAATLLEGEALLAIAEDAPDAVFLRYAFAAGIDRSLTEAGLTARTVYVDRLIALGFAAQAEGLAAPLLAMGDDAAVRLAARLDLAAGRPGEAARTAEQLDDENASRIAAVARLRLGEAERALELAATAEDRDLAVRAALRARAWEALAARAPDAIGAAGALVTDGVPEHDPLQLSSLRDLLGESTEARARLAALLEAVPPPPAP